MTTKSSSKRVKASVERESRILPLWGNRGRISSDITGEREKKLEIPARTGEIQKTMPETPQLQHPEDAEKRIAPEKLENPKVGGRKTKEAFTLVEAVIVLVIISILVTLSVPEIMKGIRTTKAAECGAAIRQIEAAKARWKSQYPGAGNPTKAQLQTFFPNGGYPKDPWGIGFRNETSLTNTTTHDYDNDPRFEPEDNCSTNNGYNDAGQPKI